MRVIDIAAVKQREQEKAKPKPVVVTRAVRPVGVVPGVQKIISETIDEAAKGERTKSQLLAQLGEEELAIRRDRNKISNRARERWKAGADEIELASLYDQINAYLVPLQRLYDKQQHVEKYGTLPNETPEATKPQESADVAMMKLEKKRLEEKKSKLRAKLKPNAKSPVNGGRKILWQEELDRTEAMWNELDQKIKKIQYESRA